MNNRPGRGCRLRHDRGPVGSAERDLCRIVGIGGEADGDLELDRIGVLELVEQHAVVSLVQESTDVGVLGEQAAGEHEQVVELELTRRCPFGCPVEHEPADDGSE